MRRGILVKDGSALERLATADTLVFDKTGTLTLGKPVPAGAMQLCAEDLALAAGLAAHSSHPLSRALLAAARAQGVIPVKLADVEDRPGLGLEARHDGQRLRLGRPDWLLAKPDAPASQLLLAFRHGEAPAILIPFEDPLRPDAARAVQRLRALGLDVRILSGDRPEAVAHAAGALGIPLWAASQSPADKLAAIQALAADGRNVLVVGDGLNDAPMLAAGHASMAPASASDVGQTAADLIFLADSLSAVPQAVETARRADTHVRQNFALAVGYNILAVPVAIAGFATPLIAAVAMSLSSLIVVANALRLRVPQ
jgi:Cu2+-exporting ATPase